MLDEILRSRTYSLRMTGKISDYTVKSIDPAGETASEQSFVTCFT